MGPVNLNFLNSPTAKWMSTFSPGSLPPGREGRIGQKAEGEDEGKKVEREGKEGSYWVIPPIND